MNRNVVVLACAVGAGLALFAATRVWTTAVTAQPPPLPAIHADKTGAALHPWLTALCLVALAGAGALLATRGPARRVVAVLVVACGLGIAAGGAAHLATGWAWLTLAGGAVVAIAGLVAVLKSGRWPGLGARYERPARPGMWEALDRGDDPSE